MRLAFIACLLLTGCVNFPNTYMPQGERKPLDGPKPKDLPAAVDLNKTTQKVIVRLNAPAAVAATLRVDCEGAALVRAFVNARAVGESRCPLSLAIPVGTIQPDTGTVVDLEAESPLLFRRISIERAP